MAIGGKYAPLTEWLCQCGKDSVRLTFDELNEIVEMFNLDLQKKNLIRGVKLSEVQDKVVDQLSMRLTKFEKNIKKLLTQQ